VLIGIWISRVIKSFLQRSHHWFWSYSISKGWSFQLRPSSQSCRICAEKFFTWKDFIPTLVCLATAPFWNTTVFVFPIWDHSQSSALLILYPFGFDSLLHSSETE
jgi:hypothetical protein